MDIQVKVVKVLETQRFTSQRTGETYVKNIFVGETVGQFPKMVAFSVMGEEKFKNMGIQVGGSYTVSFDVESREWNGKWFTEASAWRAQRIDGAQPQAAPQPQPQTVQQSTAQVITAEASFNGNGGGGADDLPF